MSEKKLDHKEERFVEEYLVDLDPSRAAVEAGYSKTTARTKAYQWVSNGKVKPHVYEAIAKAKEKRSERTDIDADWVLRRLANEAEADLVDILDDNGAIRPIKDWPKIWRQGLVAGIDVQENTIEGVKIGETVKVKLSDRIKRLELIGKHINVSAFAERLEHTGKDGGPIDINTATDDEVMERLAMLRDRQKG